MNYSISRKHDTVKNGKPIHTSNFEWMTDVQSIGSGWEYLHEVTKRYGYSNAHFKDGYRSAKNVIELGDLLIYDYDDGISITEIKKILEPQKVAAFIATTQSHQKDKKGVVCDRFRLIFKLSESIGRDISTKHMEEILEQVDNALGLGMVHDKACKTVERFYNPSKSQVYYYLEGESIDITAIIEDAKKPKPMPVPKQRTFSITFNRSSDEKWKEMRKAVQNNISYDIVQRELEAKGLMVDRNGGIFLDSKKVGNIHRETNLIRNWAESESLDIIGVLDKFYGESYTENTERLFKEIT